MHESHIAKDRPTALQAFTGWFLLTALAAAIGAWATSDAGSFYQSLTRPAWAPPASVFGPVWTILYLLMSIAVWLVWKQPQQMYRKAGLNLYIFHLIVNAAWSWLFFKWHLGALSLLNILVLIVLVSCLIYLFWQVHRGAAMLLIPYWLWILFATFLNQQIWRLNPQIFQ